MRDIKLRTKLLVAGSILTIVPLLIISAVVHVQNGKILSVAEKESLALSFGDFNHIVSSIYTLAESHQEVTEKNISYSLNVAGEVMTNLGDLSFSDKKIPWKAVNQYTKAITPVELHQMKVGDTWPGQFTDAGATVPVVDHLQELVGGTCTLFQRMNEEGDMLRVATNVIKKDGQRAIGTYIPAVNPDGTGNQVIQHVLKGKTFHGRAFVVDAWYITAYEPIFDRSRNVVGALYVGIPQENVKSLRKAIMDIVVGKTGYAFVLDSQGSYVISQDGKNDGDVIYDAKDTQGNTYVQEIINKAKKLAPGEIGEHEYFFKDATGNERIKIVKFCYFEPWDWVVCAGTFKDELMEANRNINKISSAGKLILLSVLVASFIASILIWYVVSGGIVKPIKEAAMGLQDIAEGEGDLTMRLKIKHKDEVGDLAHWFNTFIEKLHGIVGDLAGQSTGMGESSRALLDVAGELATRADNTSERSTSVSGAAEEMTANINGVAAAMEQASANSDTVATAAEEMTATIGEVAKQSETARSISEKAVQQADGASQKMVRLGEAAAAIGSVTEAISDISEQTNLLALNATIEAARAGEAGKGFAVVANEIKALANQTADATRDIKKRVDGIQGVTGETVSDIDEVTKVISEVNDIVATIATAVEEQSVATNEIATNIAQASQGIREVNGMVAESASVVTEITREISEVNTNASGISESSRQVHGSAEALSAMAATLKQVVDTFKIA